MSFFSTTANFTHRTPLPPPITLSSAVPVFRNHDFLLRLDPELVSYTTNPTPSKPPCTSDSTTKYYTVTDNMSGIPKAIYDAKVTYEADLTELVDGVKYVVRAPLGVVQISSWRVVEEKEGLVLVEDVEVKCTRLLMGTLKAKLEGNWRGIHEKIKNKMLEESCGAS